MRWIDSTDGLMLPLLGTLIVSDMGKRTTQQRPGIAGVFSAKLCGLVGASDDMVLPCTDSTFVPSYASLASSKHLSSTAYSSSSKHVSH